MAQGEFYVATAGPISGPILLDGFALVVRDYSYWNNADKPSRVSGLEWLQREESWNSVLPDSDPVVMHSFSIDLMGAEQSVA